jgi:predicted nucleic-acid-binding Zn-ribbon protein
MRNGVCPKCGYNDIRMGKQQVMLIGSASTVLTMQAITANVHVAYDVYICLYCGYLEMGMSDGEALQKIAQNWPRVPTPPVG